MPTMPDGPVFIPAQFRGIAAPAANELIPEFARQDIAAMIVRVQLADGRVLKAPRAVPGMGGMRVAFIADAEGHVVRLIGV